MEHIFQQTMEASTSTVLLESILLMSSLFISSCACPVPCECNDVTDTIDCSNRGLTAVPEFLFIPLSKIETLDLSRNQLTILNSSDFRNLLGFRVSTIDVSFNQIQRVVGEYSNGYEAIGYKTLNLSNNLLEIYPKNIAPNIHQWAELIIDISNNLLEELPARMFADADDFYPGFQFIAHSNQIREVHPEAFDGPTITDAIVDFRNNNLTSISESFKLPLGVQLIKMADNPWKCDCNFRWISRTLFRNYSVANPPICSSPGGVEGKPLFSLSPSEFACPPNANKSEVTILSEVAANRVLECPVSSDPPNPHIRWRVVHIDGTENPFTIELDAAVLNLSNIKSGNVKYQCTASNEAGSVTVDLKINLTTTDDVSQSTTEFLTSTDEVSQSPTEFSYVTEVYEEVITYVSDDSLDTMYKSKPEIRSSIDICVPRQPLAVILICVTIAMFLIVGTLLVTIIYWRCLLPMERKRRFDVKHRTVRADFSYVGPGFFDEDLDDQAIEDEVTETYQTSTSL